jgi:hypothetical protein
MSFVKALWGCGCRSRDSAYSMQVELVRICRCGVPVGASLSIPTTMSKTGVDAGADNQHTPAYLRNLVRHAICCSVRSAWTWRLSTPCPCRRGPFAHEQSSSILITRHASRPYPRLFVMFRYTKFVDKDDGCTSNVDACAYVEKHPHVAAPKPTM